MTANVPPGEPAGGRQWRCSRCRKLLAIVRGDRLHISFARGHEYLVGFPATTSCRHCKTLNEIDNESAVIPRRDGAG